jgi:hypothetical protein
MYTLRRNVVGTMRSSRGPTATVFSFHSVDGNVDEAPPKVGLCGPMSLM